MRRSCASIWPLLILAALMLAIPACSDGHDHDVDHDHDTGEADSHDHDGQAHDVAAGEDSPRTLMTDGGTFQVTYAPEGEAIPLNELFALDLTISDPTDAARDLLGVTVLVDAQMPEHGHGMNVEPAVSMTAARAFRVEGMQLHMPGRWVLMVTVIDGDVSEMASFDIHM